MTDLTPNGGAIGAVSGAVSRATKGFATSISNHDGWAIRLVFFAGIITILHKAGVQNVGFGIPPYAVVFAVCLGVAALLYEMNATTYALRSFWNGKFVGTLGWSFIWVVAFAYSMNQWVGAASENEGVKSNTHKAAFVQFADVRDELDAAKKEAARLEERMKLKPLRNAEQAQAAIDNARAHKFWTSTDGCKATKGPQTRSFCSDYASAIADKAGATDAMQVKEELKSAKDDLAKARAEAAAAPAQFSEARSDLSLLKRVSNMSDEDAEMFSGAFGILLISVLLSFATMLREMEHLRATQKRVPLFRVRAWWAAFYKFWTGKDIAPAGNVHVETRRMTVGQLAGLA